MRIRRTIPIFLRSAGFLALCVAPTVLSAAETNVTAGATPSEAPYEDVYRGYQPVGWGASGEMSLSSEKSFFTLTLLSESDRAYALVAAGMEKEQAQRYGEAMDIYQKVIDDYPDVLYRVSEFGVFVPMATYCQLRILGFPASALQQYRVKHDARAGESYGLAEKRNSLEGLAQVRDGMLATSFGASAVTTLGYSALDRGSYLEALEYFDTAWKYYPEVRSGNPRLAMAMTLCRKMLGQGSGALSGPVGHWKLDETEGKKAGDSGPYGLHGTVACGIPEMTDFWGSGKTGGGFKCAIGSDSRTASVSVPASGFLNIGGGGSDFSAALWVNWRGGSYPNGLFSKSGHNRAQVFNLEVTRGRNILYTIATENPTWETGVTKGQVGDGTWSHVALVKEGMEVRVFIDGKVECRNALKAPTVINTHSIGIGSLMVGMVDDVRLYKRALLDREVADLAGTAGAAAMTVSAAAGETPLAVDFNCASAGPGDRCFWEVGDGITASGPKFRHTYRIGGVREAVVTVTDTNGRVSVARQKIDVRWAAADKDFGQRMERVLSEAKRGDSETAAQLAGEPNVASDDYVMMPPSPDPLGLRDPEWNVNLAGTALDCLVYSQPVVTKQSVIVRHKNIIYCHSLLSGQLRWKNDVGGRVNWQNPGERLFSQEDILVKDGLVFTPMFKVGPTLVALDEVTGQIKWAYGPMVAGSEEEARMRFEAAPAAGPGTVYAGYVLDNIEGRTHVDTEYGVMAFESATGRVLWRQEVCRLRPGKFTAGFAVKRRNRIRSFISPPVFKEGTVYYCANAGALAALDALSGRIKWVMRYPYYTAPADPHDATKPFGDAAHTAGHSQYLVYSQNPMFWFNQRPLLMGDDLYVLPVDSPALMKIDRRSGKLVWQTLKGQGIRARRTDGGWAYFLGPTPGGELAIVYSFRGIEENWAGPYEGGGVHLIDPVTGKTVWELGDWVRKIDHPFLTRSASEGLGADYAYPSQGWPQMVTARPFLSSDGRLSFMSLFSQGWPHYGWEYNLAVVDLNGRKIESQRRHVSAEFLKQAAWSLEKAPDYLSRLEAIPHKDDRTKHEIGTLKAVMERGTIPSNEHGPFLPFSRVTAERFGTVFEARMGPRAISTVYDKAAVKAGLAGKTDPEALFALSELAIAEGRLTEASALIQKCLGLIPVEDLKFRAALNQQLYPTHKELARSGVLSGRSDVEISNCIGMSRTAGTLADEMETLLALSEAYERKGDWQAAATLARYLVNRYGQYEVKVSSLLRGDVGEVRAACRDIVDRADRFAGGTFYAREINGAASVMQKGMDLYFSALTPLEKDLNVRASELGAARLQALQKKFPDLRKAMETEAEGGLARKPVDERVALLSEYAGTVAAQKLVNGMISATEQAAAAKDLTMEMAAFLRKRGWRLADAARLCGAEIPGQARTRLLAPDRTPPPAALNRVFKDVKVDMEEERSPAWMVLGRRDACAIEPDMLFLGARVKKRVDNKFLLYCFDLKTGALKWKAQERRGETWFDEIRLDGSGDEAGFAEALVHGDTVVVHGRYDVLAFRLDDGKIKWRYRAPFAFEIEHAETSGDILVLASQAATVALYLGTDDPRGEVIWEETEQGMLYTEPYFLGDTLASLRKMPFNLTVRYRSTGKLIGRLELPDLLLNEDNPLVENGREALPVARDGKRLAVSDGRYYILLDAEKLKVLWKRLIDANESGQPPLRIALGGDYMAVVKKDYDAKAIYMLSSLTGEVLWSTDPKAAGSPQPIDSMMIRDGRLYGIKPHVGQGFYFEAMDCKTGKDLFRLNEQTGYGGKPDVTLRPAIYGDAVVAEIRDRQTFELKAFNVDDGRLLHTLRAKSAGDFGEHGRASATVQNGSMALLGKDDLELGLAGRP